MAVLFICGFDFDTTTNAFGGIHTGNISRGSSWSSWRRPHGIFQNKGVATRDGSLQLSDISFEPIFCARFGEGASYGATGNLTVTGATTGATRTSLITGQGFQLGVVREMISGLASSDEYWFSFEIQMGNLGVSSLSSSYEPSSSWPWSRAFRWGDVEIVFKESTYISGSGSTILHDVTFSIKNAGTEVATLTVPNVYCGTSINKAYVWALVRVRLHATNGRITVTMNGAAQSVAYVNQNTVSVTAEGSATEMYFGPAMADNGTTMYNGNIDNIVISNDAWPTGRPTMRVVQLASDNTMVNCDAYGTGPTTVTNAITASSTDAKQLRFTALGKAELNMTPPSTAGMESEILGFEIVMHGCVSRSSLHVTRLEAGFSLSSVESFTGDFRNMGLNFYTGNTVPTPTVSSTLTLTLSEQDGGGKFLITDLASMTFLIGASLAP